MAASRFPTSRACLALLGASLFAALSPCRAENLMDVYREALQADPVFEAAQYAFEAAEQKVPQARAALLPQIAVTGSESRQHGPASFSDGPEENRDVRNRNWTLQLTQPLLRIADWAAFRQADAQVRAAAAQLAQARQDLILRVGQAYFDILLAAESVAAAQAQLAAVEQQWILAQRNFEVGVATITDVHEAKSRLDLARSQKIAADNDLIVKRAELERVIGRRAGRLAVLSGDAAIPGPVPPQAEPWAEAAANASPQVVLQNAVVESLESELTRARAAHAPTVDLNASRGKNYASGSMTSPEDVPVRTRATQVGIQVNIPIWSGGGTGARVAESVANLAKARAEREAARRQAVAVARQTFSAVVAGQAQIEALSSAVMSSRKAVEANQVGYRIGTRINIDVLNAEQQLYAARRDLAKARIETLLQGLRLKAATGTLDEADVVAVNELLMRNEGQDHAEPQRSRAQ